MRKLVVLFCLLVVSFGSQCGAGLWSVWTDGTNLLSMCGGDGTNPVVISFPLVIGNTNERVQICESQGISLVAGGEMRLCATGTGNISRVAHYFTQAVETVKGEISGTAKTQAFTAAGGFEKITNLVDSTSYGGVVMTTSNMTLNVDGKYLAVIDGSVAVNVAATLSDGLLYTNGAATAIRWKQTLVTSNDYECISTHGILDVSGPTTIDIRQDVNQNVTMTIGHFTLSLFNL